MKQNKNIFYNWQAKIICFLLAVVVYFVLFFSSTGSRKMSFPISVSLPENYVATSNIPKTVELIIQGSEEVIYLINAENLSVSADFSNVSHDGIWAVPVIISNNGLSDYIDLSDVTIYTSPANVRVYFEKK